MSVKYKIRDQEKLHFLSFATVGWVDTLLSLRKCLVLVSVLSLSGFLRAQPNLKVFYTQEGQITNEGNAYYYAEGKRIGLSKSFRGEVIERYVSNNKIKAKKNYDFRGLENGIRKEYYENGQIKIKCEVKDDMPLGGFVSWYPNGQKQSERIYETQTIDLSDGEESHPTQDISCLTINYWDFRGNQKVIDGNGHLYDYYESGKIKEEGEIIEGKKNGLWHVYYENGNSCYLEKYENGSLVEGESISSDSTRNQYEVLKVVPYPKEGFKELYKQINKNMQYPRAARKNGIQGLVYIQFLVKESGELSDFSILKGISPDCDFEALNALRNTKGEWQPGLLRGIPSDMKFVFPVTFRL